MKAALSLTLVLALMTSLPVTAQEGIDRTAGPISRAITLQAVRLAAEPAVVDAGQQAKESTNADWSRVRKLEPGTEIMVTANGSQPGKRYVLSADEFGITVLNLTDSALPAAVSEVLRDLASQNPAHFTNAQKGGTFLFDKNMRLGSEGVFVADQKVAGLEQIVGRIPRRDVAEIIKRGTPPSNSWANRHPAATGALIGAASGIATAFAVVRGGGVCPVCNSASEGSCRDCWAYRRVFSVIFGGLGAGVGAGIGAVVGASSHATEGVVYRAP